MTPFFSSTFSDLIVIFISEFENILNSFSCGPPLGPFCSSKYLNFCPKATDSDSSSHFSRKQTPEVAKNLHYVLSTCRSQIPIFLGSSSCTTMAQKHFRNLEMKSKLTLTRCLHHQYEQKSYTDLSGQLTSITQTLNGRLVDYVLRCIELNQGRN